MEHKPTNRVGIVDLFEQKIRSLPRVVDVIIRLGPLDFRLVSNVPDFPAQQYFSATSQSDYKNEKTDFELWCVSLRVSKLDKEFIRLHIDHTYRADSFAHGYYVTDHFGPAVYLVSRGQRYYVFGEELERVVWSYFVKRFLMLHTLECEGLHLKAAACAVGSEGTLLLGRGGAGKTVFLTELCLHGARFLSNSHSVIKNGNVRGVASSIRIRPGSWHENLTSAVRTKPALKADELIIDPYDVFPFNSDQVVLVKNICILDFKHVGQHIIKLLTEQEAYDYAEQFSLGLNVYRLEEDLLDIFNGNYQQFSQAYSQMKMQLHRLIQQSRCYYISSDVLNPLYRDELLGLLAAE